MWIGFDDNWTYVQHHQTRANIIMRRNFMRLPFRQVIILQVWVRAQPSETPNLPPYDQGAIQKTDPQYILIFARGDQKNVL